MARKQEDIYKEPIRDGNRGGLGLFKWESIKHDKDAEHYLGSSVKAAFGRWQNNKDLDWYHKEKSVGVSLERDEIAEMKRLEAEAMAEALGTGPFSASQGESVATGSNAQPPKHESSSFQDKVNFGFGRARFTNTAATPMIHSRTEPLGSGRTEKKKKHKKDRPDREHKKSKKKRKDDSDH